MNCFQKWLETDSGKKCRDWGSLKSSVYLENRLYHAYSAGMIEEYNRNKALQSTIDWYEQKKRESDAKIKKLENKLAAKKRSEFEAQFGYIGEDNIKEEEA